jgi:hypothetical protein
LFIASAYAAEHAKQMKTFGPAITFAVTLLQKEHG